NQITFRSLFGGSESRPSGSRTELPIPLRGGVGGQGSQMSTLRAWLPPPQPLPARVRERSRCIWQHVPWRRVFAGTSRHFDLADGRAQPKVLFVPLSGPISSKHNRQNTKDRHSGPGLTGRMLVEGQMSEKIYDVPAGWSKRAWIDQAKYQEMYARSIKDPNGFWAEQAKRLDWMKFPTKVDNESFAPGSVSIKWFEDGVLNAAWNCIDRHLHKRGDQTAIIWEGDDPSQSRHITYKELHDEVCKMANILRTRNVKKGDRVTIYLPMIPEAAYAMLACARIGAIHSVVFAGFSPDSLAQRINDAKSKIIITADEGLRGGRKVPLKANVDAAIAKTDGVDWVVVVKRTGGKVDMNPSRDLWYHDAAKMVTTECPVEHMHAEDPLFILYTSGSTGRPKG